VLLLRRGPKKGSKFCDLRETLKFLNMFKRDTRNVCQLYHSNLHFDSKKIYRYLRYCIKADLLETDHIEENKFLFGRTNPTAKTLRHPRFTEASARAALEIAERKVMALQRFIKRTCEREIFNPLIQQAGLDPAKANCRLNWSREKPEVKLEYLIRLAEISATSETSYVRPEEVRKNLIEAGFELWEEKE
jgi:hypothetical protein